MAAELERAGISTVAVQLLREVACRVCPPRALWVPYPHGYPLGVPGDPVVQHGVLAACLALLEEKEAEPPVLRDLP